MNTNDNLPNPGDFDPYHRWLGIPPAYRPPTHHQLLGVSPAEADAEVIHAAALRQSGFVRNYQSGPHADAASRVLSELAEARAVLTDPARRKAYDAKIGEKSATSGPRPAVITVPEEAANPAEQRFEFERPPVRRSSRSPATTYVAAGVGVVVLVAVVVGFVLTRTPRTPPATPPSIGSARTLQAADAQKAVASPVGKAAATTPDTPKVSTSPKPVPDTPKAHPPVTDATADDRTAPASPPPSSPPQVVSTPPEPPVPSDQSDGTAWLKDMKGSGIHSLVHQDANAQNWVWLTGNDTEGQNLPKTGAWQSNGLLGHTAARPLPNTIALWRQGEADGRVSYYLSASPRTTGSGILGLVWTRERPGLVKVFVLQDATNAMRMETDPNTRDSLVQKENYKEAFSFYLIPPDAAPGTPKTVPVYKIVRPGDVLLTTNWSEVKHIAETFPGAFDGSKGHHLSVLGYAYADKHDGTTLLHRYLVGGKHIFTTRKITNPNYREERDGPCWVLKERVPGASIRLGFLRAADGGLEYDSEPGTYFLSVGFKPTDLRFYLFDKPGSQTPTPDTEQPSPPTVSRVPKKIRVYKLSIRDDANYDVILTTSDDEVKKFVQV